ncbi:MAG: FxsA family protein [Bacillota bacterium]
MRGRRILLYLILLFTLFPVAELALLIQVGKRIGTLYTVLIILGTGVLGAYLAKSQGLSVIRQVKERVGQGQVPANEIIDGVLVLFGAAFLVTPGLVTDVIGLSAVVPPTRTLYREVIKRRIMRLLGGASDIIHIRRS